MKTIEETAMEYAQKNYSGDGWYDSYEDCRDAFEAGIEFAELWRAKAYCDIIMLSPSWDRVDIYDTESHDYINTWNND